MLPHMSGIYYDSANQRSVWRVARELVRARQLLRDLVWKDLRVRYRYTVMGFVWAVVQPVALMVLLTFVFTVLFPGKFDAVPGGNVQDFPVMILSGLVFWGYFAAGISLGTHSVIENQGLVKKVHFPREVLPMAAVVYPLINFGIGLAVLILVHLFRGGAPSAAWAYLIPVFAIQVLTVLGLTLITSAAQVFYRDVGYMVEIIVLFGFYGSPVFYPLSMVMESAQLPAWGKWAYMLNPMASLLTAYREILFLHHFPPLPLLIWPVTFAMLVCAVGLLFFRRLSPTFADRL